MTVISLAEVREQRITKIPAMPADPYLCDLEARIISGIAARVLDPVVTLTGVQELCRARAMYFAHQRQPGVEPTSVETDTMAFLGLTLRLIQGMSRPMACRLRHPSRERNRRAQQDVFEMALGIRRGAS